MKIIDKDTNKILIETDEQINLGNLLEINKALYETYYIKNNNLYVKEYKKQLPQKEEILCEDEITCPFCGQEVMDSWEYLDEDELECETCGAIFHYQRNVSITYNSKLKENGKIKRI